MTQESKNNVDPNMNAPPKLGLNIFSTLDVMLLTDSHPYGIRTDDFLHEEPPSVLMVIRQTEGLVDMRLISVVFTDEKIHRREIDILVVTYRTLLTDSDRRSWSLVLR